MTFPRLQFRSFHIGRFGLRLLHLVRLIAVAVLVTGGFAPGPAHAHEVRPASLQITPRAPDGYDVVWKQPVVGDMAIRLVPHLSSGAIDGKPAEIVAAPGFLVRIWHIGSQPDLDGQILTIEGIENTVTDVLVRVSRPGEADFNAVIKPSAPNLELKLSGPRGVAVPAYLSLGVEHILTGFDHLLFVLGLLLLIGANRELVKAITAFTLAHSITLAAAALGLVHVPSAVIEALVALSIIFVARELMPRARRDDTLTRRFPWVIAFVFGLLHGLAFAGALTEIGLPPNAAASALFMFNVGVEIGQLLFVGAVLLSIALVPARMRSGRAAHSQAFATGPGLIIGSLAAYWFIERMIIAYS